MPELLAKRILLVEDEDEHAEMARRSFERWGTSFHLTIASTLAEANIAMDDGEFDLVIADWYLPDGEAIELLQRTLRFPLLLMTGLGDEQRAVAAMRAGALDYVVKSAHSLGDVAGVAERGIRLWMSDLSAHAAAEKLRLAEEELRARAREKEWFCTLVDGAPQAMIVVDSGGRIALLNARAEALFGCTRALVLGTSAEKLVPERFRNNHPLGIHYAADAPGAPLFVLRCDGAEVPVELGRSVIFAADGNFVLISINDLTERRRAEEHIAFVERRFRRLLDASPVGIVETGWDGRVKKANNAFYRLTGWDAQESPEAGRDLWSIMPDEELGPTASNVRYNGESGWSVMYEKDYCRLDGSHVPLLVGLSVADVTSDDVIAVVLDLSEQKKAVQNLRESERQLRLLADAMPQIVWTARPDGYFDYYNQRWYSFTGLVPGAEGDQSWSSILHPDDLQHFLHIWCSALQSGKAFQIEYRLRDLKTGGYRWHLGRALPLRDDVGKLMKWVGTCTDIDNHKRLSEELEERVAIRTEELGRSLKEKTTLLQEVQHRVKNNLQVICSLLSLQAESSDPANVGPLQDALHRVVAMSLIHEQLYQSDNLSDLNFGEYVTTLSTQIYHSCCVDPGRIRLEMNAEPISLPLSDAIPCGLILNELVSNSLKHAFGDGRAGVLKVSFRRSGEDGLELSVSDNGIGLVPDFQIEECRSLGLKVVRTLVRQLHGQLTIDSTAGATFTLALKRSR